MILFIKADGVDLLQPDRLLSSITFQTFKPDRHQWLLSSYKRKTFFNDIRALVKYEWFEDWSELFVYIISEGEQKKSSIPANKPQQK